MTREEVGEILGLISSVHRTFQVTPDIVDGWFLLLGKDDVEDIRPAVARILRTSKFPPSVAEIVESSAESILAIPDAESILGEVLNAVRDVGWVRVPVLSPVANAVVSTIGWRQLCDCDNWDAMRAHVLKVASTFRRRAVEEGSLALGGLFSPVPCPALEREAGHRKVIEDLRRLAETEDKKEARAKFRFNEDDFKRLSEGGSP